MAAQRTQADHDQERDEEQLRQPGVGALLRASRLRCGEELRDIAELLCIRYLYLEAIEAGRYHDLPGTTYAIGFIRAYAEHLGLDSEEVVRRFKAEQSTLKRQDELAFPTPVPESGIPKGAIVFVGLIIAGLAYGAWYLSSSEEGGLADLIGPLPERLESLVSGGNGSQPATPVDAPPAEPAGETADASPASPETTAASPAAAPSATSSAPAEDTESPVVEEPASMTSGPADATAPSPDQPATTPAEPAANDATPAETAGAASEPSAADQPMTATTETAATETAAPAPEAPEAPAAASTGTSPSPAAPETSEPAAAPAAPAVSEAAETPSPAPETETAAAPASEPAASPEATTSPESAPTETAATDAAPAAPVPAAPEPEPTTPEPESTAPPAAPAEAPAEAAPAPAAETASADGDGILIRAVDNSWVQIRDAGSNETVVTRLLRAGEQITVEQRPGLMLATGNAGGLEIVVDGKVVPSIGGPGTVRRNVALDAERLKAGTALP